MEHKEYLIQNSNVNFPSHDLAQVKNMLSVSYDKRPEYKEVCDCIQSPYIDYPNIFVKINHKTNEYKDFAKEVKNYPNLYVLKNRKNSWFSGSFEADKEVIDSQIKEKFNYDYIKERTVTYIDTFQFPLVNLNKLNPSKRKLVIDAVLELVNSDEFSALDKLRVIESLQLLNDKLVNLINSADYKGTPPRIIYETSSNNELNNMLLLILDKLAFDIIVLCPKKVACVDKYKDVHTINLEKEPKNKKDKKVILSFAIYTLILLGNILYAIISPSFIGTGKIVVNTILYILFTFIYFGNGKGKLNDCIMGIYTLLTILFLSIAFSKYEAINKNPGSLDIDDTYATKYEVPYVHSGVDKLSTFIVSNNFVQYDNKLYGYIYSGSHSRSIKIKYRDEKIQSFNLNEGTYVTTIPLDVSVVTDLSEYNIVINIRNSVTYSDTNIISTVKVANSEEELNKLLSEIGMPY